jgi:outer membrane receptor protein involved in Fe transport
VLSGAVFWKDISGFITDELEENVDIGVVGQHRRCAPAPILYDVSRPINGDKAKVWGVELGVQHFFSKVSACGPTTRSRTPRHTSTAYTWATWKACPNRRIRWH